MLGIRKVFWIVILFALLLSVPARQASAVELDPYAFRSLIAVVTFEYEKTDSDDRGAKTETKNFKQLYTLDTKGNLINRRLIIYDAGLSYLDNDYSSNTSDTQTNTLGYYLKTTLLSKSAIPLTLFGDRSVTESDSDFRDTRDTHTGYGFSWFARLRTLPHTLVYLHRTEDRGDNADKNQLDLRVNLRKDLKSSRSEAEYKRTWRENNRSEIDTDRTVAFIRNRTQLAKNTSLYATVTMSKTSYDQPPTVQETPDITTEGVSVSFTSAPSNEFRQTHDYTGYRSKYGSTAQRGHTYSGDLDYHFSSRLRTDFKLVYDRIEDESETSQRETDTIRTSGNARYLISDSLTLGQHVSYSRHETTSRTDGKESLSDRTRFDELTTLSYRRRMDWASLNTSGGVGFTDDRTSSGLDGGQGLSLQGSVGLSGIDLTSYAVFNASASERRVKNLTGDVHSRTRNMTLNGESRFWKDYVQMRGQYEKYSTTSWLSDLDEKKEEYLYEAKSSYFRNTTMQLNLNRTNSFNSIAGFSQSDSFNVAVQHGRLLYGGRLTLSYDFRWRDSEHAGGGFISRNTRYRARYMRPLLRRIVWQADLQRNESKANGSFNNVTRLQNTFFWQLRAWTLNARYSIAKSESRYKDAVEQRIFFSASRSFIRFY